MCGPAAPAAIPAAGLMAGAAAPAAVAAAGPGLMAVGTAAAGPGLMALGSTAAISALHLAQRLLLALAVCFQGLVVLEMQ